RIVWVDLQPFDPADVDAEIADRTALGEPADRAEEMDLVARVFAPVAGVGIPPDEAECEHDRREREQTDDGVAGLTLHRFSLLRPRGGRAVRGNIHVSTGARDSESGAACPRSPCRRPAPRHGRMSS